ncbi:SDR family NAD(P)-dependent oxidoreductase [Sneathiella litorea]|uniref:SDR family NAD(P)-dependent oxidoreductase n=1 Tax=Sneathiella litorea TaxID=2606216 RepID=A0A6L8WBX4_9PROT|nr:SDR family NAD(P)-dependent oxidoreductase [Sneathiella litorea]MZR32234.1 SDR family NAD(P)-dependent oxidoreductase [Sneathiella litorea]
MKDQAVWIVGGSSGIGREVARQYAEKGTEVVVSARGEEKLAETVALKPDLIKSLPLDITDETSVRLATYKLYANGNGPRTVILNAGTYEPMSFDHFSGDKAMQVMNVNYFGVVRVIERILPYFIEDQVGKIVIVASVAGYQGLPLALAYGPSKAALINLSEALRVELTGSGVTVQLVNPGFVKTPLTAGNKFPMPFLMEVEAAAERMIRGIDSNAFEVTFPRRFAYILKFVRMLPYWISLPLIRKGTRG